MVEPIAKMANELKPQEGRQTQFLSSSAADIVIYGGAAGGGKDLRHAHGAATTPWREWFQTRYCLGEHPADHEVWWTLGMRQ